MCAAIAREPKDGANSIINRNNNTHYNNYINVESSPNPGDPNKDPKKNPFADFPDHWPKDKDVLFFNFVASVDEALWITEQIYTAIDDDIILSNLDIKKAEYSVDIYGKMGKKKKGDDADNQRNTLLEKIWKFLREKSRL